MIKNLMEWLGFSGGISVWQILWEIPDAEVLWLPPGRHREGISVRRTLADARGHSLAVYRHVTASHRATAGRHRVEFA